MSYYAHPRLINATTSLPSVPMRHQSGIQTLCQRAIRSSQVSSAVTDHRGRRHPLDNQAHPVRNFLDAMHE